MSAPGKEGEPAKWTVRQLLQYCTQHDLVVTPGTERAELVRIVDAHLTNCILRDQLKSTMQLNKDRVTNLVATPTSTLLSHVVYPEYAVILRQHPDKLRDIIETGLRELHLLHRTLLWRETELHPPVAAWLYHVAHGTDNGHVLRSTLTAHSASAVCGRYFTSGEMVARCLDCATDDTSVMCMDCFQNSPCRSHMYRITAGNGGGMCDCGDPTAWKAENFCASHRGWSSEVDPTASLPETERPWIEHTLRGVVQFMTLTLQWASWVAERLRKDKDTAARAPPTSRPLADGEDTEVFVAEVNRDWVSDWLQTMAKYLLEIAVNGGDCVRRLLSTYWLEPTPLPSAHVATNRIAATCLEYVLIYEVTTETPRSAAGARRGTREENWWKDLVQSIGSCLSDSTFRVPFATMYSLYAERLESLKQSRLTEFSVQVFTNPETVAALLARPLPYPEAHDTILHRLLSATMYYLCGIRSPNPMPGCPAWLVGLKKEGLDYNGCPLTSLHYTIASCAEAGGVMVSSRTLLRGLVTVLHIIAVNAAVRKGDEDGTAEEATVLHQYILRILSVMEYYLRRVMLQLASSPGTAPSVAGTVLSPQLVQTLKASTAFDQPPDEGAARRDHALMLAEARVMETALDGLMLPVGADSPHSSVVSRGSAHDAMRFSLSFLREALRAVDGYLSLQRGALVDGKAATVVLTRDRFPIRESNFLEPAGPPVTLNEETHRLVAAALHAWMLTAVVAAEEEGGGGMLPSQVEGRLHGCLRQPWTRLAEATSATTLAPALPTDGDGLTLTLPHSPDPHRPLRSVLVALALGTDRLDTTEGILDQLLTPFVLLSQIEQGLWQRNERSIVQSAAAYPLNGGYMTLEKDIFLLQSLTLCLSPQDFACRLLQRFSYRTADMHTGVRVGGLPLGCARMLRLALTVVRNTAHASRDTCSLAHSIRQYIAVLLATTRQRFSLLQQLCHIYVAGAKDADVEEKMLPNVLQHIALGENTAGGKVFRLKDVQTWQREVNLYHPSLDDERLSMMADTYTSLVNLEAYHNKESSREAVTPSPVGVHGCLPPTELPTAEAQYEELVPFLRALLHTDGLLVPALHVIQQYSYNLKYPHDAEDDDEESHRPYRVSDALLLHAITVLYLCMKDCVAVSRAMGVEMGATGEGELASTKDSLRHAVRWDRVEVYVQRYIAGTCTYGPESVKKYMTLPELCGAQSLKAKLGRPVASERLRPAGAAEADVAAVTSAVALHTLREFFVKDPKRDRFSLRAMIDYVLVTAGLSEFSVACGEADKADAEEHLSRQQRVKEKQARLLQRLRTRGAKLAAATEWAQEEGVASSPHAVANSSEWSNDLLTKLLLSLTATECCVCRVVTAEPLMLLTNTSSSSVLSHLHSIAPLAGDRRVHAQVYVCGHAAHKTCTEKVYAQLANQWIRGHFLGSRYLGGSEFGCPICLMVCNALCPLPTLGASPSTTSPLTLFEDIQYSTVDPNSSTCEASIADLHRSIAQSAIGLSLDGDGTALAPTEDALQRGNSKAWPLSETIRTMYAYLNTRLEAVKAGVHSIRQQDLVALLSLLLSVGPARLRPHYEALHANYVRTKEDFCLLLLEVLRAPREASALIAQYTTDLTEASVTPPVVRSAMVRAAAPLAPSGDDNNWGESAAAGIAVWKELGCLVLLKLILCEDEAAGAVFTSGPDGTDFQFPPLQSAALETPAAMAETLGRMWGYLQRSPVTASAQGGRSRVQPRLSELPVAPYAFNGPSAWRQQLLQSVLHLPQEYLNVLHDYHTGAQCSICHTIAKRMVRCCFCGAGMCLAPADHPGELLQHGRTCAGGVGLFLIVRSSRILVMDIVSGRVLEHEPLYADLFGETDPNLRRGGRLELNEELSRPFLSLWLLNEWSVRSEIVKQTFRRDLEGL